MAQTPSDIYGAFADYIASQPTGLLSVWVADEPEAEQQPYGVVTDDGFQTDWSTEDEFVDSGGLTVHCFAGDVDTARACAQAVKVLFGNSSLVTLGAIPTDGSFKFIEITRKAFQLTVEPDPDLTGARVYHFEVGFTVRVQGNYTPIPIPPTPPTPPAAPTITFPAEGETIAVPAIVFEGTAGPLVNVRVVLQNNGTVACNGTADSNGDWATQPTQFDDGDYTVYAAVTVGSLTSYSPLRDFTVEAAP